VNGVDRKIINNPYEMLMLECARRPVVGGADSGSLERAESQIVGDLGEGEASDNRADHRE